jgi:hypothetical protein
MSAILPDVSKISVGKCPHCGEDVKVASEEISRLAGKIGRKARKTTGARPKLMRNCTWCGDPFSATDMRLHTPRCPNKPETAVGRPKDPKLDRRVASKAKKKRI